MAVEYNAYNPLAHAKLKKELEKIEEMITGLELIKDSLSSDEIDEYVRLTRIMTNEQKGLKEKLAEYDEHVRRKALRATLIEKAKQAFKTKNPDTI